MIQSQSAWPIDRNDGVHPGNPIGSGLHIDFFPSHIGLKCSLSACNGCRIGAGCREIGAGRLIFDVGRDLIPRIGMDQETCRLRIVRMQAVEIVSTTSSILSMWLYTSPTIGAENGQTPVWTARGTLRTSGVPIVLNQMHGEFIGRRCGPVARVPKLNQHLRGTA